MKQSQISVAPWHSGCPYSVWLEEILYYSTQQSQISVVPWQSGCLYSVLSDTNTETYRTTLLKPLEWNDLKSVLPQGTQVVLILCGWIPSSLRSVLSLGNWIVRTLKKMKNNVFNPIIINLDWCGTSSCQYNETKVLGNIGTNELGNIGIGEHRYQGKCTGMTPPCQPVACI